MLSFEKLILFQHFAKGCQTVDNSSLRFQFYIRLKLGNKCRPYQQGQHTCTMQETVMAAKKLIEADRKWRDVHSIMSTLYSYLWLNYYTYLTKQVCDSEVLRELDSTASVRGKSNLKMKY